jgi:hypothetical protein
MAGFCSAAVVVLKFLQNRLNHLYLMYITLEKLLSCCQHSYAFGHAFIQKDICQFCLDEAAYENDRTRLKRKLEEDCKSAMKKKKDHDFN